MMTNNTPSLHCIAICSVGELFGGVERHIIGLLKGLKAHDIEILLFLFHDNELAMQARNHGFSPIILSNKNHSLLSTARYMADILKKRGVKIVHVHGYKATVFSALARCWYRFSILKTEHGLAEPMAGRLVQAFYNQFYRSLDFIACRLFNISICYVTEELKKHYNYLHCGLTTLTIPNGIENISNLQLKRPVELHKDWFNLAIVGRLDTVKGHYFALQAIAATAHTLPNVHLQIIGLGPCENELKDLSERLGITHQIHFLGFQRNVYDYLLYCDALIMPSLHEGLPYTLLEAMSLGKPIIASQVGGLAEILQDNITAILVPPGNSQTLSQAISRLCNNIELCNFLGKNAQAFQKQHFTLERMITSYLDIYTHLAKSYAVF